MQTERTSAASRRTLDTLRLREIAVAAECDPRTVAKYVAHKSVAPLQRRRIEIALREKHASLIWAEP